LLFHAGETDASVRGEIPSWTPDWSVTDNRMLLVDEGAADYPHYKASATSTASIQFDNDDSVLGISGHFCDTIALLGSQMPNLTNTVWSKKESDRLIRLQYRTLLEWKKLVDSRSSELYPTGESVLTAFYHTLLGGYVDSTTVIQKDPCRAFDHMAWMMHLVKFLHTFHLDIFPALLTLSKDLSQLAKPGIWGSSESQERYYTMCTNMGRAISQQRIFFTRDRYVGLVPASSRIGDRIALVGGSKLPLVMRTDEKSGMWRLVGCCYVYGMMHGERFKGDECETIWLR